MTSRGFRIYLGVLLLLLVSSVAFLDAPFLFPLVFVVSPLLVPLQSLFGDATTGVLVGALGLFACFLFYKALRNSHDEDIDGARSRAAGGCTLLVILIILGAYSSILLAPWPNG